MKRLVLILKAIFDRRIHILTEHDLLRNEIDAARIGYDVGYGDAQYELTGIRGGMWHTVTTLEGGKVKVQQQKN